MRRPKGGAAAHIDELVGAKRFVRQNSKTDSFPVHRFHHVEFWCPDATNAYKRFQVGLGMQLVAKSDQGTGNGQFGSYVLRSGELIFVFTAPYSSKVSQTGGKIPHPGYKAEEAFRFTKAHGFGARAIGVVVDDAREAFDISVRRGAVPVLSPVEIRDEESGEDQVFSEVRLYGDVVLRYVSGSFTGPYLAQYSSVDSKEIFYGIRRLDHVVGNVEDLLKTVNYVVGFTGFHEFAEFTAEDVGTVDSGLNNLVLANNNEYVLLPLNEPTFGTRRKSQIQTYLEQHEGAGVQHLALKTDNIFTCLRSMKKQIGGFEFMPRASDEYYQKLPERIGDRLTPAEYAEVEELGIMVDKDEEGILLQIFTRPISDRATVFLEIIQRIGCEQRTGCEQDQGDAYGNLVTQKGGCGGFGNGNVSELFLCVEKYERTLRV